MRGTSLMQRSNPGQKEQQRGKIQARRSASAGITGGLQVSQQLRNIMAE
eukprot:SAG31_NODE_31231_length_370_cov_1.143911_1_plen_48_part_10